MTQNIINDPRFQYLMNRIRTERPEWSLEKQVNGAVAVFVSLVTGAKASEII